MQKLTFRFFGQFLARFGKQWWDKNMTQTICDNMIPFMFWYLKWFGRRADSNKQTRSRTFTVIVVRFTCCLYFLIGETNYILKNHCVPHLSKLVPMMRFNTRMVVNTTLKNVWLLLLLYESFCIEWSMKATNYSYNWWVWMIWKL